MGRKIFKIVREKKKKIDELANMMITEYQLKVIKRSCTYPEIGDIFKINPKDDIFYYGIVINNHITSIYGKDLLVVLIFDNNEKIEEKLSRKILKKDLLLTPCLVTKDYWTKGYFSTVNNYPSTVYIGSYGFYRLGKGYYVNEYNEKLNNVPNLASIGVYTISGIAYEMNKEMIIRDNE